MTKSVKQPKIGLRPLAGYVLVQPASAETRTVSGIVLPDTAQEKPAQGVVLSIGDDLILDSGKVIKAPVKVGDKVVYKKWGGDEIKAGGTDYKLVKFDDLMAVMED